MANAAIEMNGDSSSQEENEGVYHQSAKGRFGIRVVSATIGVVGLAAIAAVLALHGSLHPAAASPQRLTVRALLESDELTDLATDNLMAMGGSALSAGRDRVRGHVASGLKNVSDAIRIHYPEAHRQLESLELTSAQKEASLRVVRKFGDPRMVGLARDISEATHKTEQESGDQETFRRHLSEALAPKIREVQQLSAEMFPGQTVSLDASAALPQLRKWSPSVEVDLSARRLSEDDDIAQGVQVHAHTLFKSLQGELGDKMPEAPARMLTDDKGEAGFMACVMKAMPNPPKVIKCMADNMSEVIKMMTGFLKGKA